MPGSSSNPSSNQGGAPVGQPVATCKQLFWIVIRLVREPYLKKPPYLKKLGDWWLIEPAPPYVSEQFSAEITDGHKDAETDGQGGVRYDDIPSGSCSVHFKLFYQDIELVLHPVVVGRPSHSAPAASSPPPPPNYSVDLVAQKNKLTLKHDHQSDLQVTVTPAGATVDEYRIEIKRASGGDWCTLCKESVLSPWVARIAGKFKLRGVAKIGGSDHFSAEKDVEVQFPSYSQIVGDPAVQTATDDAWCNTLNDCTSNPNQRREHGFWIRLNTLSDAYEFSSTKHGDWCKPEDGAGVDIGSRPSDDPPRPSPNDPGATYYLASFHTHTSTEFRTIPSLVGSVRPIGPSDPDKQTDTADDVPGVVYDYTESPAGSVSIPMGHPKTSAAKLYYSAGKDRRSTPP
jgi:hypothetical protein